jgi:hypothetical protein
LLRDDGMKPDGQLAGADFADLSLSEQIWDDAAV